MGGANGTRRNFLDTSDEENDGPHNLGPAFSAFPKSPSKTNGFSTNDKAAICEDVRVASKIATLNGEKEETDTTRSPVHKRQEDEKKTNHEEGAGKSLEGAAQDDDETEVVRLRRLLEAAEARAMRAEQRLGMWEDLLSRVSWIMMLGPEMLEYYKRLLLEELSKALEGLEQIEEVKNLKCSFPAVSSEAPRPSLVHWGGDFAEPMEWDLSWTSTSWVIGVSVVGRQYGLSFSLALRLHHFGIRGRVRVVMPDARTSDLSRLLISFVEFPEVDCTVECNVTCGVVPLPVQSQVASRVRSAFDDWLAGRMVEPNAMPLTVPALKPKTELSEEDVKQAIQDAELARTRGW